MQGEVSSADAFWLTADEAARFLGIPVGLWLEMAPPPEESGARPRWRLETMRALRGGFMQGEVTADPDRLLTSAKVAACLGIRPDTWRSYVTRGRAPAPDVPDLETPVNRRRPLWKVSTVRRYVQNKKRRAWKLPAK